MLSIMAVRHKTFPIVTGYSKESFLFVIGNVHTASVCMSPCNDQISSRGTGRWKAVATDSQLDATWRRWAHPADYIMTFLHLHHQYTIPAFHNSNTGNCSEMIYASIMSNNGLSIRSHQRCSCFL